MIAVCDMGPLHYLVLIGAEHVLPQIFDRVLTPPAVLAEMGHPDTPMAVRGWAAAPPQWLEVKDTTWVEDIPSLGRKGARGAGEKAAIALACEERADVILMDDKTGRREARKRHLEPLWMLEVLDEAAERAHQRPSRQAGVPGAPDPLLCRREGPSRHRGHEAERPPAETEVRPVTEDRLPGKADR